MTHSMTRVILCYYIVTLVIGFLLRALNLRHLKRYGADVPPGFEGAVDRDLLARTSAYTLERSRVGLVESLTEGVLLIAFFFGGLLETYDRVVASFGGSFITGGVLFLVGLSLAEIVVDIPFNYYSAFHVETRYGFTTMSLKLWFSDLAKTTLIGLFFTVMLAGGALGLVRYAPGLWWLLVWGFFAAVTVFFLYLSPYVIEPLFNTFEPVRAEGLEEEIRSLLGKAGLSVSRVLQVDASRRSRHSNAYFTGIGRVKRIVLYDTLLEQMSHGEILAILAHEVGHWKRGHIWKRLLVMQAGGLAVLYAVFRLLAWGGLPGVLGLSQASFAAQVAIIAFIGALVAFPAIPLTSWLSRRHEWEADRFARDLTGAPEDLATALIKLTRENLANLHPHPLYARFYYTHPPVVERVARLRSAEDKA